ncbi:hypothetical protein AURDEDRAFT_176087 [Auricularia subglabra TFB-10046 SS5]|nr:hypothetical protein AURDEDRAFT_176087 [Auricularia subglabra TFB-10046 SS5]
MADNYGFSSVLARDIDFWQSTEGRPKPDVLRYIEDHVLRALYVDGPFKDPSGGSPQLSGVPAQVELPEIELGQKVISEDDVSSAKYTAKVTVISEQYLRQCDGGLGIWLAMCGFFGPN